MRQAGCPEIRSCLAIGGVPVSESLEIINKYVKHYSVLIVFFQATLLYSFASISEVYISW